MHEKDKDLKVSTWSLYIVLILGFLVAVGLLGLIIYVYRDFDAGSNVKSNSSSTYDGSYGGGIEYDTEKQQ